MQRKYTLFGIITGGTLILDQWTKMEIVEHVGFRDEFHVIEGFLSIVHAKNKGAAFSAFSDYANKDLLFAVFTVVAVVGLLYTLWQLRDDENMLAGALGLILGGALGNAIDRVRFREVTDFIRVYTDQPDIANWLISTFGTNTWPIFNVADMGICVGVGLFFLHYLLYEQDEESIDDLPDLDATT